MSIIRKYWHWILAGGIFFCEAVLLFIFRKNIYVGICDNLDLFIIQLKMLHDQHTFFSQGVNMPILGGIDRDYFPTEFSVYNILYFIMPDIYAYITGYLLKLLLAFGSSILLAKLILGAGYRKYEKIVVLAAVAFALLPVYPMYALCFASLPLLLYLLIRVYRKPVIGLYLALFLYPLVSYFSFFGAFILGYLLIAFVILWIRDRKCPLSLLGAFAALAAGYVCFEYRLFRIMFASDTETIRSTMVVASYQFKELWNSFVDVFLHGFSHARSAHTYFVLPLCGIYFVYCNACYIRTKQWKKIAVDPFNLTVLFIVFNCIIYALYFWEPLRNLVEIIVPPLKGFQYGRTIFFNTFAWYFALAIVLKRIYDKNQIIPCVAGVIAILVVVGTQSEYSDFYNTVYCNLYKMVKHAPTNQLSYGEFYGEELFDEVAEAITYDPSQGVCVYGFHPAQLSYNGFTTIDGYCGYYSEEYKQAFREVIAPTLDRVDSWQHYYDDWGCRAYLFSADGSNTYDYGENSPASEQNLYIDTEALKNLGCDYIFSRMEIGNAKEEALELTGVYTHANVPYQVYVYKLL